MTVQRGRSKRRGEAYSEYVEPLNEARTKLADFFNIVPGYRCAENWKRNEGWPYSDRCSAGGSPGTCPAPVPPC